MFAFGILVGKVAKVAYIMGVKGCARYLIIIFLYTFSLAKIAKVAGLSRVQGPVRCMIYVYSMLIGR